MIMDEFEEIERYEEMMSFFDKWDKDINEINRIANKFLDQLAKEIIQISVQYYPETKQYQDKFTEPVSKKIKECGLRILDTLDYMFYSKKGKESQYPEIKVPERDQTESERIYREETLKKMPPEQHATFISLDDPRVKQEAFERVFKFLWHNKIKELLYLYYPEIINLPSNHIRWLDYTSYSGVLEYIEEFYFYSGEYIIDRFPLPD